MDYERGKLRIDSLPRLHIHRDSLHTLGLKFHFYLDDWLLRNASKDILKLQMKLLIKNVKLAGWIMNEKSELTPSQNFMFIGIRFCTRVGLMSRPPDRIAKILSRIGQLSALKFCQTRGDHVNEVDLSTKGTWSQEIPKMSINILELKARTKECPSTLLHSKTGRYLLSGSLQDDMGASPGLPLRERSFSSNIY
jgi:hypothetical protein